ncbi:TPA: porin [Klebsiella quasipneumoniae subsp. similipneumoniae]|nr:porin [Klebsiella quasipneumoniae subsp. similipneumoniae]
MAIAVAFLFTLSSAYATQPNGYINWQHEYYDKDRKHNDRVQLGLFFQNGFGMIGELRYNTKEGGAKDKWDPSQFNNNGQGLSFLYKFSPLENKKFWLEPMFWLDSSEYWTTYEYGITAGYNFSKEWRSSFRFRYDMDKATAKSKSYGNDDRNNKRYDLWIDYRPENYNFQYQINLTYYDNEYLTWNNKNTNYRAIFKVGYKMGQWFPYVSVADNKGTDKTSDQRQIMYRTGLSYSF